MKTILFDSAVEVYNKFESVDKATYDSLLNTKEKKELITLNESISKDNDSNLYEVLYIGGIYTIAEKKNQNGRIYSETVCDTSYAKYVTDYVNQKRAYGETMHPEYMDANLNKVSLRVLNIEKKDKVYNGKAMVLPTTAGKEIQAIIKTGGVVGVSTRGTGDLVESSGQQMVQDWDIYAVDIVGNPSVAEAIQDRLNESKIIGDERKINHYKKLQNEIAKSLDKNFKMNESLKLFYYIINTL